MCCMHSLPLVADFFRRDSWVSFLWQQVVKALQIWEIIWYFVWILQISGIIPCSFCSLKSLFTWPLDHEVCPGLYLDHTVPDSPFLCVLEGLCLGNHTLGLLAVVRIFPNENKLISSLQTKVSCQKYIVSSSWQSRCSWIVVSVSWQPLCRAVPSRLPALCSLS